jgi:hypothetical protein
MKTCLYRHFDRGGTLLYVGVSLNPFARTSQHKATAKHFHKTTKIEVEWFDSRDMALAMELKAIKTEKPKYNNHHNLYASSREDMTEQLKAFSVDTGLNRHSFLAAEDYFGSHSAMAEVFGVASMTISRWKHDRLPPNVALKIERLTGGLVTRVELLPEIFGDVT